MTTGTCSLIQVKKTDILLHLRLESFRIRCKALIFAIKIEAKRIPEPTVALHRPLSVSDRYGSLEITYT